MRLVFAGTPDVAVPSLALLVESRHDVVAVVTRPDAPSGRGRRMVVSPVARAAAAAGIEVLQPPRTDDEQFAQQLMALQPDLCPVVAFGSFIPQSLLALPKHGWVNLHFSLLPAWRGAAPVQHAILNGDDITGACTFHLEAGLDTGPIFGSVTEPIAASDTSGDLLQRLAVSGAQLLLHTADGIESGTLRPVAQPAEGVSLAPKLSVGDARIDWATPALHIDRLVRACTPSPGAWTTFRGERLKILPMDSSSTTDVLPAGTLEVTKSQVQVGTGSRRVTLSQVQPQGKRPMSAADWARGARVRSGELFQ